MADVPSFTGFKFVDNIFDPKHQHLADIYKKWGRCLLVTDGIVGDMYRSQMEAYFEAHQIPLTIHIMPGGEINKVSLSQSICACPIADATTFSVRQTMDTMLSLVEAFAQFGLIRKEPVLAVGGGLVTDVCGVSELCARPSRISADLSHQSSLVLRTAETPTSSASLRPSSVSCKSRTRPPKLAQQLIPRISAMPPSQSRLPSTTASTRTGSELTTPQP